MMFRELLSRLGKPAAALGVAALTALGAVVVMSTATDVIPDQPRLAQSEPCPKYVVYAVRGTGEPEGRGAVGNTFVEEFAAEMGPDSVVNMTSRYPARGNPLKVIAEPGRAPRSDYDAYQSSLDLGVAALLDDLQANVRADCRATTTVVLVGYSQGAHVIRNALPSLTGFPKLGAALFGDPCWSPDSSRGSIGPLGYTRPAGDYEPSRAGLLRQAGVACADLPPAGYYLEYCHGQDIVCQGLFGTWTDEHFTYAPDAREAARRMAQRYGGRLGGLVAYARCAKGRVFVQVFGSGQVRVTAPGSLRTALGSIEGPRPDGAYLPLPALASTVRVVGPDDATLDELTVSAHGCVTARPATAEPARPRRQRVRETPVPATPRPAPVPTPVDPTPAAPPSGSVQPEPEPGPEPEPQTSKPQTSEPQTSEPSDEPVDPDPDDDGCIPGVGCAL